MKILHINDTDLDDPRIINAAMTGKKEGYDVYFCGMKTDRTLSLDVFSNMYWLPFSPKAKTAASGFLPLGRYWPLYPYPADGYKLLRSLKQVVDKIRPDLIHAHDIFAAYFASLCGVPIVFDDHELYSMEVRALVVEQLSGLKKLKAQYKEQRWRERERQLGERHPIITVSRAIAKQHEQYCENVFVVPNYPSRSTIQLDKITPATNNNLVSTYLGADSISRPFPWRDITGLYEIFSDSSNVGKLARIGVVSPITSKIRSFGYLPMVDAYAIMKSQCHVGLLPWKKHWFHAYISANKAYEYAHCGLWLVMINDLGLAEDFPGLCDTYDSRDQLISLLQHYNENSDELNEKRERSLRHSQTNLVWEKNEDKIIQAYRAA